MLWPEHCPTSWGEWREAPTECWGEHHPGRWWREREEMVQFLTVANGQLKMATVDARLLVVTFFHDSNEKRWTTILGLLNVWMDLKVHQTMFADPYMQPFFPQQMHTHRNDIKKEIKQGRVRMRCACLLLRSLSIFTHTLLRFWTVTRPRKRKTTSTLLSCGEDEAFEQPKTEWVVTLPSCFKRVCFQKERKMKKKMKEDEI